MLTWLVYIELSNALHWLNNTCKRAIAHGDIRLDNILIRYPSLSPQAGQQQLPQVTLIDSGNSKIQHAEPGYECAITYHQTVRKDRTAFLFVLFALMARPFP